MGGLMDGQNNVQGYYRQYFHDISCHVFIIVLLKVMLPTHCKLVCMLLLPSIYRPDDQLTDIKLKG